MKNAIEWEETRCPLCESDSHAPIHSSTVARSLDPADFACTTIRYGEHPPLVRCVACGFFYSRPRPTADSLKRLYRDVVDESYMREFEGRLLTYGAWLDNARGLFPAGGRILDLGCYAGPQLDLLAADGYRAVGVDLSRWALKEAAARGHRVLSAEATRLSFPSNLFDGVTFWDVIEHLTDPRAAVREIARVLRPGGVLVLGTHDLASPAARLLGRRYPFLMMMHIAHFTRESIRRLLRQEGFDEIRITPHVRILRGDYILSRIESFHPIIRGATRAFLRPIGLAKWKIPIRGLGLMTVTARRRS